MYIVDIEHYNSVAIVKRKSTKVPRQDRNMTGCIVLKKKKKKHFLWKQLQELGKRQNDWGWACRAAPALTKL